MMIVWDEPKRLANLDKHGLDFADVENGFDWSSALVGQSYENRFKAIGFLYEDLVALVFAPLGLEAISIISLRPASRKERNAYAQR